MSVPSRKLTIERTLSVSAELEREDEGLSDMLFEAASALLELVRVGHPPGPEDSWLIGLDHGDCPMVADNDAGRTILWDSIRLTWLI